jgi:hypothetical protein
VALPPPGSGRVTKDEIGRMKDEKPSFAFHHPVFFIIHHSYFQKSYA